MTCACQVPLGNVPQLLAEPDDTTSEDCGVVVPMPTLPSIINPPVGAAVVSYPLPKLPPPLTLNFDPGAVSPMPTLPSIINPPVGAAVVLYPLPKLPPPLTLNFDPGAVSPMPTLPVVGLTTKYAGLAASCM